MENKEQLVEICSEPKIESRFGFGKDNKILSKRTIKYCSFFTLVSLSIIFLMKSPEINDQTFSTIKIPDVSQINSNLRFLTFDNYSATQENHRLNEKNKKIQKNLIIKLPGLQKIDRRKNEQIPPGSLLKAVLVTSASNGPVRAEVVEALRVQGETLVPRGTILFGHGQSTEERLMIRFNQMVFKDGNFRNVQAQAADVEDKIVGLQGSKVGAYAMKYATAIGLNFVGGMTEGLQERETVGQQVVTKPTMKNALLNGASKATLEMANETVNDVKNSTPIIQIPAGREILIMFSNE